MCVMLSGYFKLARGFSNAVSTYIKTGWHAVDDFQFEYGDTNYCFFIIPFGWDFVIIAIFCLLVIQLAIRFTLPAHQTKLYVYQHLN